MEYKDYYKIMNLKRDASQDDIKRAYRKLARKYHPDISKESDAEAKFKEVGEAYEVLKDPEKRAAYDHLGPNLKGGQDFHPPPNWNSGFEFSGGGFTQADLSGYSDFFEELFGRQGRNTQATYGSQLNARGQDHHAKVIVELEDAFHGVTRSISLQSPELDEHGQMRVINRTLNVKIPKGIKEGQQIRLMGQGTSGMGLGEKGDLYLEIHFKSHQFYRVEGRDLHMQLPVTPWEVALGATVKAPTPNGNVDLKIPTGSNSGNKLRLKGRGIPGNPVGDIYVTLSVIVPPANNEQAKVIYQEMANKLAFNPRIGMGV
ncbi:MAG: DnaJ domain-containing protein [Gammaproteobacteria bacterium]|nr:DnaJ domain-containing protein [Gammaproteobacteria bacterium]